MSKHTPGPWNVYDDSNDGKTNRIEIVAIGKTIAHIYHSVPRVDLPNAHLIAAAPDMYEALEAVNNYYSGSLDHQPPYVRLARAALAKAKAKGEA